MTHSDFESTTNKLLARCKAIQAAKRPEYTGDSTDVLLNFKESSTFTNATAAEVWGTFFFKHAKSCQTLLNRALEGKPIKASEPPIERFADAINYLLLGWALFVEAGGHLEEKRVAEFPRPASPRDVDMKAERSDVNRNPFGDGPVGAEVRVPDRNAVRPHPMLPVPLNDPLE